MIFRAIKNQWYLLQLENYDLGGFLKLVFNGVFFTIKTRRKPLVFTNKLKLVIATSFALQILLAYLLTWAFFSDSFWLGFFAMFGLSFLFHFIFLVVAVILVWPADYYLKHRIINAAMETILTLPNLKIIAITGSFGKTTMKESLFEVLSQKFRVLKTLENINTPVGVARFILEKVNPATEVLIVEMGAFRRGDIAELCEITRPDIAVLTGINEAHLELFGSIENTVEAKFEIVVNSKPEALLVLNMDNAQIMQNYEKYAGSRKVLWYNSNQALTEGLRLPMLGKYALGVLNACVIIAKELGLNEAEIRAGAGRIKPIEHRLQLIENPNGITVIDDSYNGNPDGVKEAVNVLAQFKDKRKIYITPGLVQMGSKNREVHYEIGRQLAKAADLVILIKNSATPFIFEGLQSEGFVESNVIWFDSASFAHNALKNILKPGDVILFQNDWPENYL